MAQESAPLAAAFARVVLPPQVPHMPLEIWCRIFDRILVEDDSAEWLLAKYRLVCSTLKPVAERIFWQRCSLRVHCTVDVPVLDQMTHTKITIDATTSRMDGDKVVMSYPAAALEQKLKYTNTFYQSWKEVSGKCPNVWESAKQKLHEAYGQSLRDNQYLGPPTEFKAHLMWQELPSENEGLQLVVSTEGTFKIALQGLKHNIQEHEISFLGAPLLSRILLRRRRRLIREQQAERKRQLAREKAEQAKRQLAQEQAGIEGKRQLRKRNAQGRWQNPKELASPQPAVKKQKRHHA